MVEMSIDPKLAASILTSNQDQYRVGDEVLTIAAMLTVGKTSTLFNCDKQDPYAISKLKKKHGVTEGDHISLLNLFNLWSCRNEQRRNGFCKDLKLN